jgi:phosphatidylserine synthase 2
MAALVLRNAWVLNIWSILDELLEISFSHYMPHFRECRFDKIVADLLLTNTPAIFLGMFVLRRLGWEEYDWFGIKGAKSIREWKIWHCHRHWNILSIILGMLSVNFLADYFFMNALWIPRTHFLVILRLGIWYCTAFQLFRESYNDVISWDTPARA